jgi:hypothetical protein
MSLFSFFNNKDRLKDLAPIIFYFDFIPTPQFKIPILPCPMRIDKLILGNPTLLIQPNYQKLLSLMEKSKIYIDFKKYYVFGIKNLINYAKKISREREEFSFKKTLIYNWFRNSLNIQANIPTLVNDLDFLFHEFLNLLIKQKELENDDLENYRLISKNYFTNLIGHFEKRLILNEIDAKYKGEIHKEKIFFKKKGKIFPKIIKIDAFIKNNRKITTQGFVPYLIYRDLIDIFNYNKTEIVKNKNLFDYFNTNQRICIESNIKEKKKKEGIKNFELKKININKILR